MLVCKVQFKKNSKKYFFNPNGFTVEKGSLVVVETIRGVELGEVFVSGIECPKELEKDIKPILRVASKKDLEQYNKNKEQEPAVFARCKEMIAGTDLEMKLLACEYTLDHQKLMVYYEAEDRVDFRQLVKDLAEEFHARIEMRQIGSRDGAKILGGLGPCGLPICCSTFIDEFDNVSIKMAKNQNLSLNPQKISGTCGKLLCCIKYENEVYTQLKVGLPDVGDIVTLEAGEAKVLSVDVLKGSLKVKMLGEEEVYLYPMISEVKSFRSKKSQNGGQ